MGTVSLSTIVVASMGAPSAVLDFGVLPPAGMAYSFSIEIRLQSGRKVTLPVSLGETADPEDALELVKDALPKDAWKTRRVGLRLNIAECSGSPVVSVRVQGTGRKPTVNWAFQSKVEPER